MLSGKRHILPLSPGTFATLLPVIVSVPLALVFGLAIPLFVLGISADPSVYIIGIVGLGVLTSLDIRRGFKKTLEAFAVTLLVSAYVIDRSVVGQSVSPLSSGELSFLLVALPPSLGVVLAGLLFSSPSKYRMVKANLVGSVGLAVGVGVGASMSLRSSPADPVLTLLYYVALSVPANMLQAGLFFLLERVWKSKRVSFILLPTGFFVYNLLNFLGFWSTQNPSQLYTFFSSLAFLPALVLVGVRSGFLPGGGSSGTKVSTAPTSSGPPSITITGASLVQQGQEESIRVITESRGRARNMASISTTVTRPGGKSESLKLSRVSQGEYKARYRPGNPGSYSVRVSVSSQEHQTADKSFSFSVQAPAPRHASRGPVPTSQSKPPPPMPQNRAPPPPSQPVRTSPLPQPVSQPPPPGGKLNLPSLANWDPRLWVNQEIHGYVIREYLATGLSGYVLRASFEHGGNEVAIKIPILKPGTGNTALDETMSEATRLLELSAQSKYLVQLRGILVDRLNVQEITKGDAALYLKSPPAIVMELMKGSTAKRLLEDPAFDSLYYSEKWGGIVMLVGEMIAMGLETIHGAGFVHLDVKPQNVLFNVSPPTTGREFKDQIRNGTLVPKLADLGSAIRIGGKINQFTSEYAPGEQVLGGTAAATAMDIYALGATLYNLLTKTPANSKKLIDSMNSMAANPGRGGNDVKSVWNNFRPDLGRIAKFSPAVSILGKMLAVDPQDRPAATLVASSLKNLGDMTIS